MNGDTLRSSTDNLPCDYCNQESYVVFDRFYRGNIIDIVVACLPCATRRKGVMKLNGYDAHGFKKSKDDKKKKVMQEEQRRDFSYLARLHD